MPQEIDAEKINIVVDYALAQLGEPYVDTPPGAQPPNSWDCSKLVSWAYKQIGVNLTPLTTTMVNEVDKIPGVQVGSTNNLQRGDLLFYFENSTHHVAMYIGGGQIVEAGSPVRVQPVWWSWSAANFTSAGRVKGATSTGNNSDNNNKSNQRVVTNTRSVGRNAVVTSRVSGTPQTGRFAVLNVANESVFISSDSDLLSGSSNGLLIVKSDVIDAGEQYELKVDVAGGKNGYEIIIDTELVQTPEQAKAVASMLARSLAYRYKSIDLEIFGNPLIEVGDIIRFTYNVGKVSPTSPETSYFIVGSVKNTFSSGGLNTSISLRPLIQTVSVI